MGEHGPATRTSSARVKQMAESSQQSLVSGEENFSGIYAYLQRGETRLSTLHRVAGVFLGGAGLLTLFPVFFRDAFFEIVGALSRPPSAEFIGTDLLNRGILAVLATFTVGTAIYALYLLLKDLVLFYFTAHHLGSLNPKTYPRFILSGIRVSAEAVSGEGQEKIDSARRSDDFLGLLVPKDKTNRRDIVREAKELDYQRPITTDSEIGDFLFDYTASIPRTIYEEVAKMEVSLARHHSLLRVLVLRYAKAFLLTILTTLAVIVVAGLLRQITGVHKEPLHTILGQQGGIFATYLPFLWLIVFCVFAAWSYLADFLVQRPIKWISHLTTADQNLQLARPVSLVAFERLVTWAALLTWAVALVGAWLAVYSGRNSSPGWYTSFCWIAGSLTFLFFVHTVRSLHRIRKERNS